MPQVGLASSCCCRRKAPQPSPLTLGSPVGTMAVPYPPTRGGDGALGCERWDLRSPQWGGGSARGLDGGHEGPYLGAAEGQLQDAQGQPGWQRD